LRTHGPAPRGRPPRRPPARRTRRPAPAREASDGSRRGRGAVGAAPPAARSPAGRPGPAGGPGAGRGAAPCDCRAARVRRPAGHGLSRRTANDRRIQRGCVEIRYRREQFARLLGLSARGLAEADARPELAHLDRAPEWYGTEHLSAYRDALGRRPARLPVRRQLFLNFKGGTGKTSLSVSYAYRLAEKG